MEYSVPVLPERPKTTPTSLLVAALATCVVVASLGWWAGRATAPRQVAEPRPAELVVIGHSHSPPATLADPPASGAPTASGTRSSPAPSAEQTTPGPLLTTFGVLVDPSPSTSPPPPSPLVDLSSFTIRSAARCLVPGDGVWEVRTQVAMAGRLGVDSVDAVFTSDGDGDNPAGTAPMTQNGLNFGLMVPSRPAYFVNGTATWHARITLADGRVLHSPDRIHQVPKSC